MSTVLKNRIKSICDCINTCEFVYFRIKLINNNLSRLRENQMKSYATEMNDIQSQVVSIMTGFIRVCHLI